MNANPDTVQIAQRTLSSICRAVGKMQVSNSEQLHLIPLIADVRVRPPKGQYGESNSIRYLPVSAPTAPTGGPRDGRWAQGRRRRRAGPDGARGRPALEAPGLGRRMTEHTVPAAPIDMPETVIGCRKLLAALQDDIASIRVQIATNDIRRQTARKGLDPDWFHRARTALRLKQHEVAQVTVHMASLMRGGAARSVQGHVDRSAARATSTTTSGRSRSMRPVPDSMRLEEERG